MRNPSNSCREASAFEKKFEFKTPSLPRQAKDRQKESRTPIKLICGFVEWPVLPTGLTIGSPRGVAAWVFIGWLVYMAFAHPITGCVYLCCYKKPPAQGKEVDCPKAAGYIIGGTSICCAPCICIMLCQGKT